LSLSYLFTSFNSNGDLIYLVLDYIFKIPNPIFLIKLLVLHLVYLNFLSYFIFSLFNSFSFYNYFSIYSLKFSHSLFVLLLYNEIWSVESLFYKFEHEDEVSDNSDSSIT